MCGEGEIRNLPSARWVRVTCPNCGQSFLLDRGVKYDRHEYIYTAGMDSGTCPTCLQEYGLNPDIPMFGIVLN